MEWFLVIALLIMVSYHNMTQRDKLKKLLFDRMDNYENFMAKLHIHEVKDKFTYVDDLHGKDIYQCKMCYLHVTEEYNSIKSREGHICQEKV